MGEDSFKGLDVAKRKFRRTRPKLAGMVAIIYQIGDGQQLINFNRTITPRLGEDSFQQLEVGCLLLFDWVQQVNELTVHPQAMFSYWAALRASETHLIEM